MLHMTYHWLTILLHRPFYRRRRTCDDLENYTDHVKPCNKSAAEIMELAGIWRKHFSLRYVPITMIQVVSAAATIFVVAAVQAVSGPRIAHSALEAAEKSAGLAIEYLREVGESFASALNVANILQNLLQEQVQTRKARRSPGSSSDGANHLPPVVPGQFPNSLPNAVNAPGWNGGPNAIATSSWMGLVTPFDGMYANSQYQMGYSGGQYAESSLAGALGAPLSYPQPFGIGLEDPMYFPPAAGGMGVENINIARSDSLAVPRSSQEAPYGYQMGVPPRH